MVNIQSDIIQFNDNNVILHSFLNSIAISAH